MIFGKISEQREGKGIGHVEDAGKVENNAVATIPNGLDMKTAKLVRQHAIGQKRAEMIVETDFVGHSICLDTREPQNSVMA